MENILEIKNLCKNFWDFKALDNININIQKWSVYWFIWPNWSWKSTTLKIISSLIKKSSWDILFDWKKLNINSLNDISVLLEPNLYLNNTWFENLEIHRLLNNNISKNKIKELLELVWLDNNAAKKLVKNYSLWMKQRLWIAICLMKSPKLLILDEPTNWLDINWIRELRELIIKLKNLWTTIVISSHNLPEIQKACTHVGVIYSWVMKFEWTLEKYMSLWDDIENIFIKLTA